MAQGRYWAFTLNNFVTTELTWDPSRTQYAVWSHEIGAATGTPHLQGYVEFFMNQRLSAVYKILPTASWSLKYDKSTREQCRDYCQKVDDPTFVAGPWVFGVWRESTQGKRNDYDDFRLAVAGGASTQEMIEKHPRIMASHPNFIHQVRACYAPRRDEDTAPVIKVYWGPPGVGKTHRAKADIGPDAYYVKRSTTGKWWDGYEGQPNVIIDEVDKGHVRACDLLVLLDKGTGLVEVKGTTVPFSPTHIWLTANTDVRQWMPAAEKATRVGIFRRCHQYGSIEHIATPPEGVDATDWEALFDAPDGLVDAVRFII